jgi:hypothetical protein
MVIFNQAKSCSKGYRLFAPQRDPSQFYLVPPGMRLGKTNMSSKHDAGEGSSSGAKRQKEGQSFAEQSEQPLQVWSEGVTSKTNAWERQVQAHSLMLVRACHVRGRKKALPFRKVQRGTQIADYTD